MLVRSLLIFFKIKFFEKLFQEYHQSACTDPEGGGGGGDRDRGYGPRLKSLKPIGFLSNTGPDALKNHKATKPAFNVGPSSARQRNAI